MNTNITRVTMIKPTKRNLQPDVITKDIATLLESVNNKSLRVGGWEITTDPNEEPWTKTQAMDGSGNNYVFQQNLVIVFQHATREFDQNGLNTILRTMATRGPQPKFGRWSLAEVDGEEFEMSDDGTIVTDPDAMIEYAPVEIPDNWDSYFSHLYGLEPQILRVKMAIEAAIASNWQHRFNVLLGGLPGCGKSDVCASVTAALGSDAVLKFDGTATTAAGGIKELSEREILPRVIIVEEIEKAPEQALSYLLGVMDIRGEVRKTTARKDIQRDTKCLVIATVNDVDKLKKLLSGALFSRFSNKVGFHRPSRDTRQRILEREVGRVSGDFAWVDPALDYAEKHDIDDPREIIALCLTGRDRLVSGEYQQMLADTELAE